MFPELRKRAKKAGQPPGTPIYTGSKKNVESRLSIIHYSDNEVREVADAKIEDCLLERKENEIIWINVTGLQNTTIIDQLAKHYKLHPLTVEDILNVDQRPKVEEFESYYFITLRIFTWNDKKHSFLSEQLSLILGKNFVLTFEEYTTSIFNNIRERLSSSSQRIRQQSADYLAYRLLDTVIDYYFVVLEGLGDQIEKVEEQIISSPTPKNTRTIYKLKRQLLLLRKSIWPVREVVSHLLQSEEQLISSFTRVYMRDLYDHVVQAIDTIETFRDMLSSMLDIYLSSLTNRMNEVMKTLTIIATIFIPITFIASVFGMNFKYMPELYWHWGYYTSLGGMLAVAIVMLIYFRLKKWI